MFFLITNRIQSASDNFKAQSENSLAENVSLVRRLNLKFRKIFRKSPKFEVIDSFLKYNLLN
jgi:hypothetical protein